MSQENKKLTTSEVSQVKKKIIRLTALKIDEKEQEPNRDIELSLDDYISCRQQRQQNLKLNNYQSKPSERVGIKFKECLSSNSTSRNKNNWKGRKPRRGRNQSDSHDDSFLYTTSKKTILNSQSYSHQYAHRSLLAAEDYYYYNNNNNNNNQNSSASSSAPDEDYPPSSYLETYEENFETEDNEPYTEEIYEFDIDPEDGILKPISTIRYSTSLLLDPYQHQQQHQEPKESSPIQSEAKVRKISESSKKSEENLNLDAKKFPSPVKPKAKSSGYWMNGYEEIIPDDKIPYFILMTAQIKEEKEDEESTSQSQSQSQDSTNLDNDVKNSISKSIFTNIPSPSTDKII